MKIFDYYSVNYIDKNYSWDYLEDEEWNSTPFELSKLLYNRGNGYHFFLQNDQKLIERYDINLII